MTNKFETFLARYLNLTQFMSIMVMTYITLFLKHLQEADFELAFALVWPHLLVVLFLYYSVPQLKLIHKKSYKRAGFQLPEIKLENHQTAK